MPRHRNTTPEQRLRWQLERDQKMRERDATRHIVGLADRPEDDGIVDHVAIDLALRGHTRIAALLRREELVAAIETGTRRGLSALELAELLLLHEREIDRFRALLRRRERRRGEQAERELEEAVAA